MICYEILIQSNDICMLHLCFEKLKWKAPNDMVSYGMICFAIRFEHKHILKSHEHFGVKYKKKTTKVYHLSAL